MNKERTILQTYKEFAGAIVEKHLAVLGSQSAKERKTQESYKDITVAVKLINRELEAGAEKMLAEAKPDKSIDRRRLNELLFIIRRDFFNDFLNRNQPAQPNKIRFAY